MSFPHVSVKKVPFGSCCPTRRDDPKHLLVPLGPNDQHQAAPDRTDGNETIFVIGMGLVEEF
jgi:hypothetical protein